MNPSKNRFLLGQNSIGINKILNKAAIQFRGRLKDDEGSKIENRLVIMIRGKNVFYEVLFYVVAQNFL